MQQELLDPKFDNQSFLFKEQYVVSHPNLEFLVQNSFDGARLHYITGRPIITPNGKISNLNVPQIVYFKDYQLYYTDKKIILWDGDIRPMYSVGWHFKAALEELASNFFYQKFEDISEVADADILITVRYWKRPKEFKGIYVLYDTEALHRSSVQLQEIVAHYDYVFLTTLQDVEILNYAGYKNVFWLPPAASSWHYPMPENEKFLYHATMIGNYNPSLRRFGENRFSFFEKVAKKCSIWFGRAGAGDAYVSKLWEAPITLDRSTGYNIGTRPFETLASGRFTLTNNLVEKNRRTGLDLLLVPGIHYGIYEDTPESCYNELMYWLNRTDRQELANEASKFVHKYHLWKNRLSALLRKVLES